MKPQTWVLSLLLYFFTSPLGAAGVNSGFGTAFVHILPNVVFAPLTPQAKRTSFWSTLEQANSLSELNAQVQASRLSTVVKAFVHELHQDPQLAHSLGPGSTHRLVILLRRGLLNFERRENPENGGVVGYRLIHPDESVSYILKILPTSAAVIPADWRINHERTLPEMTLIFMAQDDPNRLKLVVQQQDGSAQEKTLQRWSTDDLISRLITF